ncbi:MAG TPA: YbhB/YbcL family Raf kinase inhibitor-like protein, partial [Burkholderiales bacterium]|nr:YbhB/YbcL family Raf kinase inhibitor-like protein [Burkholderiales bacterium]
MAITLTSSAFTHNGSIPQRYTCQGDDVSVPLAWNGLPAGTKSLALIMDDPDAPDPRAPKVVWVHGVLYTIPPSAPGLKEAIKDSELPAGTTQGL